MSAQEFEKKYPALAKAIRNMAKTTVEKGIDPAKMIGVLMRAVKFRREVWPKLTKVEQTALMAELRRMTRRPEGEREKRKPRRYRDEIRRRGLGEG